MPSPDWAAKNLIILGGVNISPTEIENVLSGHPQIVKVAVVGRPDDRLGSAPNIKANVSSRCYGCVRPRAQPIPHQRSGLRGTPAMDGKLHLILVVKAGCCVPAYE